MYVRNIPMKVKSIYSEALASTTAGTPTTLTINGAPVTVFSTTGLLYVNSLGAASATTGLAVWDTAGHNELTLYVPGDISILGNSTTAKYQAVVWE